METMLAEADSFSNLGKRIELSATSVRKHLNGHLGAELTFQGGKTHGMIVEVGQPTRTTPNLQQLGNRNKLPPLVLC